MTDPLAGIRTVLAGVPVDDLGAAVAWYRTLFGRPPDLEPVEGVVEWSLTATATVQLLHLPASAGHGVLRVEVADLDATAAGLASIGVTGEAGVIEGVVRYLDLHDPAGNEVSIVQRLF